MPCKTKRRKPYKRTTAYKKRGAHLRKMRKAGRRLRRTMGEPRPYKRVTSSFESLPKGGIYGN